MELLHLNRVLDFVGWRKFAYALSGLAILLSVVSLATQGLNYGIDFAGGTLIQVRFDQQTAPIARVRSAMLGLNMGDVVIQEFGDPSELLIRVEQQESAESEKGVGERITRQVMEALTPIAGGADKISLRRVEFVGPQVGKELAVNGLLAIFYSMIAILVYVAWRFEFRFALGAVLALCHDTIITVGFFSLFQREFTLVVVAAILTIIGYSINDTIVVYDRIREEMKRLKRTPLPEIINTAVTITLSRTIITSLTVVLVLIALFLFGGEVIHDFALALLLGVVVGTYSSIFVASPIVLLLDKGETRVAVSRGDAAVVNPANDN